MMNQKELRAAFWREHPQLSRKTIRDYAGMGRMYPTDTRVAWNDFIEHLRASGVISDSLCDRATLLPVPRVYEWQIQGNYGGGFECECSESTFREARERLREYRENGPGVYRLRRCIVKP